MDDLQAVLNSMTEPASNLRSAMVNHVRLGAEIAAHKSAATVDTPGFTTSFATGFSLEESTAGAPRESAAKELLRYRDAQKSRGADGRLSGLNFSNRGAMTSPLMDQIVESGVQQNTDDVRTQKASGSRKANSRQKQAKDKGEGYSDKMGERMASKAHRRDRVAKLKRMY